MIRQEVYKLFIKNKLIIVFLIGFIIQCLMWSGADYIPKYKNYNEQKIYVEYMEAIEGKLTAEKVEKIESDYYEILRTNDKKQTAIDKYSEGEITKESYMLEVTAYDEILEKELIVTNLYNEISKLDSIENRYILTENGWHLFFPSLDIELITFAILALTAVVAIKCEKDSFMDSYNLTTKKGRIHMALTKITVLVITTILISSIMYFTKLFIYTAKFGGEGWNYPLSTIGEFTNTPTDITVLQGALVILLIRIAGWIYLTLFVMAIAAYLKSAASVATTVLSFVLIPAYIASKTAGDEFIYKLPLPNGLLKARGFIMGDYHNLNEFYAASFTALSKKRIITVVIIDILVVAVLLLMIIIKLSGKKFRLKRLKKSKALAAAACVSLLLTGCGSNNTVVEKDYKSNYIYVLDFIYNKKDNMVMPKKTSPFSNTSYLGIYNKYLLKSEFPQNQKYINCAKYSLVDLETYEEKEIYTRGNAYDYSGLMDLEQIYPNILSMFVELEYSVPVKTTLDGDKLCLIYEDKVDIVDINTQKVTSILENYEGEELKYYKGKIFYLNNSKFICSYDIESGETEVVIDKPSNEFTPVNNGILWSNNTVNSTTFTKDGKDYQLPYLSSPIVCETSFGFVATITIDIVLFNNEDNSVNRMNVNVPVFSADDDGLYGVDFSQEIPDIVMLDYEGNVLKRCKQSF